MNKNRKLRKLKENVIEINILLFEIERPPFELKEF